MQVLYIDFMLEIVALLYIEFLLLKRPAYEFYFLDFILELLIYNQDRREIIFLAK